MKLKLVSVHEMTLSYFPSSVSDFSLLQEPTSHVDDEYARAGIFDPKILITTSRDPSSRLQQFSKEMRLVFPNSQRINRGNHVMKEIVDACRANEVTDLIILHEHRGQPGKRSTHIGPPFHTANT